MDYNVVVSPVSIVGSRNTIVSLSILGVGSVPEIDPV
jgi:hypothetical protein